MRRGQPGAGPAEVLIGERTWRLVRDEEAERLTEAASWSAVSP